MIAKWRSSRWCEILITNLINSAVKAIIIYDDSSIDRNKDLAVDSTMIS